MRKVKQDNHLHTAQQLLSTIDDTIQESSSLNLNIPDSISISRPEFNYTEQTYKDLKYNLTTEDTANIVQQVENKDVGELNKLLKHTQQLFSKAKAKEVANSEQYAKLINERSALEKAQETAVNTYNQEVTKFSENFKTIKTEQKDAVDNLLLAQKNLTDLIDSEIKTAELLENIRTKLKEEITKSQQAINNFNNMHAQNNGDFNKLLKLLNTFKNKADNSVAGLDKNTNVINSLLEEVQVDNRTLAVARLTQQIIIEEIETIEAEEAQRIAEQKAREEEERAKAIAQCIAEQKAKEEEERAKAVEALLKRKEAELKAQAEAERAAKAQAEAEKKAQEEQNTSGITSTVAAEENKTADNVLSPAEAAEQAKLMLEAQRERRRKAAEQKKANSLPLDKPTPQPIIDNTPDETAVEKEQPSVVENIVKEEPIISKPVQPPKAEKPVNEAFDPMAALYAEWEKENQHKEQFAAEQKARNEEIERRKAELKNQNTSSNS